jgi:hypothetical protein
VEDELDYVDQSCVGNVSPFFLDQLDHLGSLAFVEHLYQGSALVEQGRYLEELGKILDDLLALDCSLMDYHLDVE